MIILVQIFQVDQKTSNNLPGSDREFLILFVIRHFFWLALLRIACIGFAVFCSEPCLIGHSFAVFIDTFDYQHRTRRLRSDGWETLP